MTTPQPKALPRPKPARLLPLLLGRALPALALLAACGLATIAGLELARARAASDIYRERLGQLTDDYRALADRYNTAVRRTAVTELLVEDGRLTVIVRSRAGELARVPTPYDPSREIYVDFALVDGRLWIRRVFDDLTPPAAGTVIDPALASIDWTGPDARVGQAIYRALAQGRWVVTVSGSGALSLTKLTDDAQPDLAPAPPIADFAEIEAQAATRADRVTLRDALMRLLGG